MPYGVSMAEIRVLDLTWNRVERKRHLIHGPDLCRTRGGHCPFHNPSDHHMVRWPRIIRFDMMNLTERVCPHGVSHPDPDSLQTFIDQEIASIVARGGRVERMTVAGREQARASTIQRFHGHGDCCAGWCCGYPLSGPRPIP